MDAYFSYWSIPIKIKSIHLTVQLKLVIYSCSIYNIYAISIHRCEQLPLPMNTQRENILRTMPWKLIGLLYHCESKLLFPEIKILQKSPKQQHVLCSIWHLISNLKSTCIFWYIHVTINRIFRLKHALYLSNDYLKIINRDLCRGVLFFWWFRTRFCWSLSLLKSAVRTSIRAKMSENSILYHMYLSYTSETP